jgi:nitroreductase
MDFYDVVKKRRSIRSYDPDNRVEEKILLRIMEAGRLAPSACNYQPWRFLLISSPVMLEKVHRCYPRNWFHQAPHVLAVVGRKDKAWVRGYDGFNSLHTDLAIAMDHMILAATAEGVATCWICAFEPKLLHQSLGLPDSEEILAMTPLGYPPQGYHGEIAKDRKPLNEIFQLL